MKTITTIHSTMNDSNGNASNDSNTNDTVLNNSHGNVDNDSNNNNDNSNYNDILGGISTPVTRGVTRGTSPRVVARRRRRRN